VYSYNDLCFRGTADSPCRNSTILSLWNYDESLLESQTQEEINQALIAAYDGIILTVEFCFSFFFFFLGEILGQLSGPISVSRNATDIEAPYIASFYPIIVIFPLPSYF